MGCQCADHKKTAAHADPQRDFFAGKAAQDGFIRGGAPRIQRKCAARDEAEVQTSLTVGATNDSYEREADRVADRITGGPAAKPGAAPGLGAGHIQRLPATGGPSGRGRSGPNGGAAPRVSRGQLDARRGRGAPLGTSSRSFFEPRMGTDLGGVRVHADAEAGRMAGALNAKAFTYGNDIFFGPGRYAPSSRSGKHLLAHELTHTVQQGGGADIRRAELEIIHADLTTVPTETQRQAAASCDVKCDDDESVGTLHTMPLFFHTSRGAPSDSNAGANGVGAAIHFIQHPVQPPLLGPCPDCTDFRVIQILNTNAPAAGRGGNRYVDNAGRNTPFYDAVYLTGTGLHNIPGGYVDAGEQVNTTRSIYDRPFRTSARLGAASGTRFFWHAEACITCVKPGNDLVMGDCTTYGFERPWDAGAGSHGPLQAVGPACNAGPSADFVSTLGSDPTTSSYKFDT